MNMKNQSLKLIGFCAVLSTMSSCSNDTYRHDEIVQETYIHKYGVEVPPSDWTERGQHGKVISMLKNGVEVTQTYAAGILDGEVSYTFPHSSTIEKVEQYSLGTLTQTTLYFASGDPRQQTQYLPDGSLAVTYWYETGSPKATEQLDAQGRIVKGEYYDPQHATDSTVSNYEGMRVLRDEYGQIVSQDAIQGGMMASCTTFYSNGSPKEVTSYDNGVISGVKKTYLPDGEPNTIETWTNGRQQGITTAFQNGQKYADITYQNGIKNGIERRYRDGSQLAEEISWLGEVKHGRCVSYVAGVEKVEWFYKGQPTTQANFDLSSNSVIR